MLIHRTAKPDEQLGVRDKARVHEHRRARDDESADQFDTVQSIVVDHQPRHGALDDTDATCAQVLALLRADGVGVGEQGDVGRPLPYQQRVLDSLRRAPSTPSGWLRTS
jgi:hypothetical protein